MAKAILERNKEYSNNYNVQWNGLNGFEISEGNIHLLLTWRRNIAIPDQHVEHWYKKETFLKAYNHFIQLISNMRMWPETTNPSIEPPKPRKMPGRPGKKRRKSKDEPKKRGKLSRK
ncbi:hypothetical protein H5410_006905 [Solanum commersonii]|uniref:Uncharacterized protein n=1 Tax=Solanum commersonii TaxID=4109 RepID=A0A9J6ACN2_SOLCO|nr:hypothetical protein H5410_006905 [Solanum commersonii]